jgi:hypothetical protein
VFLLFVSYFRIFWRHKMTFFFRLNYSLFYPFCHPLQSFAGGGRNISRSLLCHWIRTHNLTQSCARWIQSSPKSCIYRVSREECIILREGVPYVKTYRYNPKHLYPKLNGHGDKGQRKVWSASGFHTLYLPADRLMHARPSVRYRITPYAINKLHTLCW